MNTWIVGNIPQGHYTRLYGKALANDVKQVQVSGEKTFFMKGRIMAGQANLEGNKFGLHDFQWLARDEIQKTFLPRDWNAVKNMLARR